jgi:hypothetical protein
MNDYLPTQIVPLAIVLLPSERDSKLRSEERQTVRSIRIVI